MRFILALACAALTLGPVAVAADPLGQHMLTPAMSAAIDKLGRGEVTGGQTPGVAVAVVEDGRWVYARGFGYANLATRRTVQATTEFYAGGITNQFTAAAILLLVQDGKLKLDDRVTKWVPELTVAKGVTVAQLLQQTSGLPDYTHAPGITADPTRNVKLADFIAAVNKMQPQSNPGAKFAYNNFNYFIAGLIVERASSISLSDFLQARIFQPLSMSSSFMAGDTGISPMAAVGYTKGAHGFVAAKVWNPSWLLGAGGLVTNVYDLAKWDIGFPLLVRDDGARAMFTPSGAPGLAYGMGWVVDQRAGKRYLWHNGELGGYHAMNALLPDQHIAVIVLANADELHGSAISPEAMASRIMDIVAPPAKVHVESSIISRAREWLARIADKEIDRTQLTTTFNAYLTDQLVSQSNFARLGKLLAIVPVGSRAGSDGGTVYEFLVQYPKAQYHYKISITQQGKINGLTLSP